jgi:putative ABC transport system permease protein
VPPKEGTPAAHGRWALRREYRSSYRDALGSSETVVKGAWWRAGEWRGRKDGALPVSLEAEVARELGVGVGDEIVWDVQGVPLTTHVASLRHVEWARFEPNFFAVFPEGPLDAAPQTFATFAHVPDAVARGRLQRRLAERFPNLMVLDLTEVQGAIRRILDRIGDAARFLALFSLAAGVVVLLGALGANQDQRVREGVLLKTLGATRGQVARVVLSESLALGALAAATGLLLAVGASWALARFVFELEFTLPTAPLAAIGLGLMGLTGVVGAWSSAQVFRSTPLAALRDE